MIVCVFYSFQFSAKLSFCFVYENQNGYINRQKSVSVPAMPCCSQMLAIPNTLRLCFSRSPNGCHPELVSGSPTQMQRGTNPNGWGC